MASRRLSVNEVVEYLGIGGDIVYDPTSECGVIDRKVEKDGIECGIESGGTHTAKEILGAPTVLNKGAPWCEGEEQQASFATTAALARGQSWVSLTFTN